ncbi:MAG: DUF1592 domain-containing protein [Myxococcota bacterium]
MQLRYGVLLSVLVVAGCRDRAAAAGGTDTDGETDGGGSDDGDDDDPPEPAVDACGGITPDTTPIRRMTAAQFANTVHDLLGDEIDTAGFPTSQRSDHGYSTDADANLVTELGAQLLFDTAESVATQAALDLGALLPCDAGAVDEDCVQAWIDAFAPEAFRRPLTDDEAARLLEVYENAPAGTTTAERVAMVLAVILQSPQFLYVTQGGGIEVEDTSPDGEALLRLSDWEIAARLSYLLWETTPDDALRSAAEAGELHTAGEIAAQAERMLDDPRAESTLARFHAEWLQVENVGTTTKNPEVYPAFDSELAAAMAEETRRYVLGIAGQPDGTYAELIAGRQTQVNAPLAALYGMEAPAADPTVWAAAEISDTRSGLLTQAAVLSAHANLSSSNPVKRGAFVQEQILCTDIPAPPPGIPPLSDPQPGQTPREVLAEHRADPGCAGCHDLIDPPGLALENFDGIGAWRDEYYGQTIDVAGALPQAVASGDGAFQDAREMLEMVAESEAGARCYARKWFHFTTGEPPAVHEACTVQALSDAFLEQDGNIRSLLVHLVTTPAFRHRLAD